MAEQQFDTEFVTETIPIKNDKRHAKVMSDAALVIRLQQLKDELAAQGKKLCEKEARKAGIRASAERLNRAVTQVSGRHEQKDDEERLAELRVLKATLESRGRKLHLRSAREAGITGNDARLHYLIQQVNDVIDPDADDPLDHVELPIWPVKSACAHKRPPKPERKQSVEKGFTDEMKCKYRSAWPSLWNLLRREVNHAGVEPQVE